MFLSVEWAKRWLPSVFLLLSLFLPWWTMVHTSATSAMPGRTMTTYYFKPFESHVQSFLWEDDIRFYMLHDKLGAGWSVEVSRIPYLCSVSALVLVAGLCGLSGKNRTRTLGGPLGIAGVVSYLVLILPKSPLGKVLSMDWQIRKYGLEGNPYFGTGQFELGFAIPVTYRGIWFLSVGFYLAIAGSLMLLLPLIRTLIERLRKRAVES